MLLKMRRWNRFKNWSQIDPLVLESQNQWSEGIDGQIFFHFQFPQPNRANLAKEHIILENNEVTSLASFTTALQIISYIVEMLWCSSTDNFNSFPPKVTRKAFDSSDSSLGPSKSEPLVWTAKIRVTIPKDVLETQCNEETVKNIILLAQRTPKR